MKLKGNLLVSVISTVALTVLAYLDKRNPIGLFDRIEDSNKSSQIVGILLLVMFGLFIFSFLNAIIALFKDEEKRKKASDLLNTFNVIPITIIIFLFIDTFLYSPVVVKGPSMENTLYSGDYLIIDHIKNEYKVGDIIIINNPNDVLIIKRVVATEGQTINVSRNGEVSVDGILIESHDVTSKVYDNYTLKEGEYYCLGDNRGNSQDSRAYGIFSKENIYGKAVLKLNPFEKDLSRKEK